MHNVLFLKINGPLIRPNMACVQLWMHGRGFEPRQALAFIFHLHFVLFVLSFFFCASLFLFVLLIFPIDSFAPKVAYKQAQMKGCFYYIWSQNRYILWYLCMLFDS